jgi:pimeloyl-ACP methyl ester carboxylesterase
MAEHSLSSGVTLHVNESGAGRPVVFIHGWTMSGHFFQRQLDSLSERYRVVIPDLRGHGKSEKVLNGHTVATYAADLRELFGILGVDRPVLIGWSMGAMVIYEYLKLFGQDEVAAIVVVDQPPSDFAWDGYPFGVFTLEELAATNRHIQVDHRGLAEEFVPLMLHQPDDQTKTWMVEEILQVPPAIASTILVDQTLQDYRPLLPEIRVPTLVLFGEDTKLTNPAAGRYIAEQVPGARFKSFPNSSHCPFYEESEAFNKALTEFVDALP